MRPSLRPGARPAAAPGPGGTARLLGAGPLLAVVMLTAASLVTPDPASAYAVPLLGTLGLGLTALVARLVPGDDDRAFVRDLMYLGVAARLLIFMGIHGTVGSYVLAPDQYSYEFLGRGMLAALAEGAPLPSALRGSLQVGYPVMNAALFAVFGEAYRAPAMLNIFLSVWVAVPILRLCRIIVPAAPVTGRLVAGLSVLFPSLMIWSTLNIREAPTILLVVAAVYFMSRIQHRGDAAAVVGTVVALGALALFREYLMVLVGAAGVAGVVMGRSRSPIRSLALGSLLLVALTWIVQGTGAASSLAGEPSLEQAQALREAFQFGAGSAYGQGADVSTPAGAITYLPVGLAYFLLAPFPWEIGSTLQAITLPETVVWWLLLPVGIRGFLLVLGRDLRRFTVPVAVLVTVTFAYALVESNVGTAFRHRAQVLPLGFIFCAIGLHHWISGRRQRARIRAERRARAWRIGR